MGCLHSAWKSAMLPTAMAIVVAGMLMGQGCPTGAPVDNGGGTQTESQFLGASECRLCHSRHYDDWAATNHAGALDTLKAIGMDTNPTCVRCHVVGFGEEGGFVNEATTPHLAGVQCENCHGPGLPHRSNVDDRTQRPSKSIASDVCGKCHNDVHHPTFDEWKASGHAINAEAEVFSAGNNLTRCGICHSGDYRIDTLVEGLTLNDASYKGIPVDQLNAVTCVVCHDPHKRTGNVAADDTGKDYQLRYPEVVIPELTNKVSEIHNVANPTATSSRYNLCGQCHHSREATWTSTSRPPHHSVQFNFYLGEMPIPDNTAPLLPNQRSVHRFVPKQCVTCHMQTAEFTVDRAADSGHTFELKTPGCSAVACHPSEASAIADTNTLAAEVDSRLAAIASRLGPASAWEYTSNGGPNAAGQAELSDEIKKIRFEYYYLINDGSKGTHNPTYARNLLSDMESRLTALGR